jgi:putative ABC transport system permease protein
MATNPPLGHRWSVVRAAVGGRTVSVHFNGVDPAFFQTMSIPLLRGRTFDPGESQAIVVSESLARLQWPAEDPIGKTFRLENGSADNKEPAAVVVGVVGSARLVSPEDSDAVEIYRLAGESAAPALVVLVKTRVPPESVIASVAATAKAANPRRFPDVQLLKLAFRDKLQIAGFSAVSVGLLGSTALGLACVGIVGLMIFSVSQRTQEIGVRIALGARSHQVFAIVLRELSTPVAGGLLAGVVLAALLSHVLRQELFGVSNLDPLAYVAAIATFAIATTLAALVPARRALRVDPLLALRHE